MLRTNNPEKQKFKSACLLVLAFLALILHSCNETEMPDNPYDKVDYGSGASSIPEPDPNSIAGIHKNILIKRCALSGCHDGTFEPDFRTVQSSYSSLVYNPVIKNTVDNNHFFNYRVLPNDISNSFLIERLTTNTSDYMPSNGSRLANKYIDNIKNWIAQGAKDQNGNQALRPDLMPNITNFVIFNSAFNFRYDTIRVGGLNYNPAIVPFGVDLNFVPIVTDEADSAFATPVSAFTNCRIELSLGKDSFPSSNSTPAYFISTYNVWNCPINTSQWPSGTTVYCRFYVNDGHHAMDSEFPRNTSINYYKSYFSFYVQ